MTNPLKDWPSYRHSSERFGECRQDHHKIWISHDRHIIMTPNLDHQYISLWAVLYVKHYSYQVFCQENEQNGVKSGTNLVKYDL